MDSTDKQTVPGRCSECGSQCDKSQEKCSECRFLESDNCPFGARPESRRMTFDNRDSRGPVDDTSPGWDDMVKAYEEL